MVEFSVDVVCLVVAEERDVEHDVKVFEEFSSLLSNGLFSHPLPTFSNDGFPFLEVPLPITSGMPFATVVIG